MGLFSKLSGRDSALVSHPPPPPLPLDTTIVTSPSVVQRYEVLDLYIMNYIWIEKSTSNNMNYGSGQISYALVPV